MTCKEISRQLRYGSVKASHEIKIHAQYCVACNEELAISNMVNILVVSHNRFSPPEQSHWDDLRLINCIKARINERRSVSWDIAIIAVRGWLLAFSIIAIVLLLATNPSTDQATSSNKISRSNTNWSEELISTNASPNLPSEEDQENGH